jgi:hypothetical protein
MQRIAFLVFGPRLSPLDAVARQPLEKSAGHQTPCLSYPQWHWSPRGRGRQKQIGDPQVVGGWVRGQKSTRVRFFVDFFNRVFELPSPRNAPKRDKTIEEKIGFGFLVDFFVKTFRHDFLVVPFNSHR